MTTTPTGVGDFSALERQKEQKAWYWYDWANSDGAVLAVPHLGGREGVLRFRR